MSTFAEVGLQPDGIIAWLMVGLGAGCLAGIVMKGRGNGFGLDIILGLVGAVIGGFAFDRIVIGGEPYWGSIAVAFVGACISIAAVRFAIPAHIKPAPVRPGLWR